MKFWKVAAVIKVILIPMVVAIVVSGSPRYLLKHSPTFKKLKNQTACLPLGSSVSKFTQTEIYSRYSTTESMCNIFFYLLVHEVEDFLLHAELSKQLHEIRRSTNHMLQVWKRDLPSEHKHRKPRRVQQAGAAAKQHQLPGTQDEVLGFYSSSVYLHSKNNNGNKQRVKQKCRLPTIRENMIWLESDRSM